MENLTLIMVMLTIALTSLLVPLIAVAQLARIIGFWPAVAFGIVTAPLALCGWWKVLADQAEQGRTNA